MHYEFHPFERVYHRRLKWSGTVKAVETINKVGGRMIRVEWDHRESTSEWPADVIPYSPLEQLAEAADDRP